MYNTFFIDHNCIIRCICTTHFLLTITALFGFLVPIFYLGIEEVSINYYKISTFGSDYLRAYGCAMCVLVLPLKYQLLMIFLHIIALC